MKMKLARVAAIAVAVILAVAVMWTCTAPRTPSGGPDVGTVPLTGTGGLWDPNAGSQKGPSVPSTGTEPPRKPLPPVLPTELPPVGTEVKPGQEVSIVVPWKRGDVNRFHYEIEDLTLTRDRESGDVTPSRMQWRVHLDAIDGDGTGAARIRLTVDSLHVYGFQRSGLPFDVDSRDAAANPFMELPEIARQVKPLLVFVGLPLEFSLDRAGNVSDVRGFDQWHARFVDEVRLLEKGGVGDPPDAPDLAQTTDMWAEYLLPRLGGGTIKGGESRPWTRVAPGAPPWSIVWTGTVAATRDDPDAFRVDIFAGPEAKHMGGTASGAGVGIAKVRAIGHEKSYHAAYRFGRAPAALLEAQIDAKYEVWVSRQAAGGAPGTSTYSPTFNEVLRRVIVRRTPD